MVFVDISNIAVFTVFQIAQKWTEFLHIEYQREHLLWFQPVLNKS